MTLQEQLDAGGLVTLPAGDFVIGAPLILSQPVTLQGAGMGLTRLIAAPGTSWGDQGLLEIRARGVTVRGLMAHGNKAANPQGRCYGFAIRGGAEYVLLDQVQATDCPGTTPAGTLGGDGLLIWVDDQGRHPYDITVRDSLFTDNVRQGISICAGRRIRILSCTTSGTSGSDPGAGLDFEPTQPTHAITDVVVRDHFSVGNAYGVLAVNVVGAMMRDIDIDARVSNNRIEEWKIGSNTGMRLRAA